MKLKYKKIIVEMISLFLIAIFIIASVKAMHRNRVVHEIVTKNHNLICDIRAFDGIDSDRAIASNNAKTRNNILGYAYRMELLAKEDKSNVDSLKKQEKLKCTKKFAFPTNGQLTSRFGPRKGSFHRGIDLASRVGTPIRASEGGVIVFVGYRGSYGYMVEICHSGGYNSRYAHCSKIYVKIGEEISRGDIIAAVGNTGRSSGPHVHFEILKHGVQENPLKYVKRKK
ncbi:M23 family metallopeptidase [Clostridiaceae bacterium M8S5]|nr:M23 family metallopeptidase [Clostridiaceae bacterium M8S5]